MASRFLSPLLALLDLPFGAFWDIGAFTILTGMILTRVGCLLNGCCGGRPSPWGLNLPKRPRGVWTRRIPTQCLEGTWAATLLVGAVLLWDAMPFAGALFAFVVAGYCCGRLVLESLRDLPGGRRYTVWTQ